MKPQEAAKIYQEVEEAYRSRRSEAERLMGGAVKELQKVCEHNWVYHPDPSGNNDSSWECSACKKERFR